MSQKVEEAESRSAIPEPHLTTMNNKLVLKGQGCWRKWPTDLEFTLLSKEHWALTYTGHSGK